MPDLINFSTKFCSGNDLGHSENIGNDLELGIELPLLVVAPIMAILTSSLKFSPAVLHFSKVRCLAGNKFAVST